jgi:NAD(P)-dependent dehydrogenase (short-subunit alcohol dehydrogenase family)
LETGLGGKVVVITGGAGGMGAVIASQFAAEGSRLLLVDRVDPNPVPETECDAFILDVTAPHAGTQIVDRAVERFGRVDVLINSAGVVAPGRLENYTFEDWDRVFNLNVKALFFVSQAVGSQMGKQGGGRIINIASIAGLTPSPGNAIYGISKSAVIALTESFAIELGPQGVRCNAVAPGFMAKMMRDSIQLDEAAIKRRAGLIPTRRAGKHEDIAATALFLASDAASQINGQTVLVDGGLAKTLLSLI